MSHYPEARKLEIRAFKALLIEISGTKPEKDTNYSVVPF